MLAKSKKRAVRSTPAQKTGKKPYPSIERTSKAVAKKIKTGKGLLWILVPFCSLFVVIGLGDMWHSVRSIVQGCQAADWPSTVGRIVHVKSMGKCSSENRSVEIQYRYSVDGDQLEGSTIHPCYDKFSVEEAHVLLERLLHEGVRVKVHYNPIRPAQSCLATGFYSGSLTHFFGGLLFTLSGLCFLGCSCFAIAGNGDFASGITRLE